MKREDKGINNIRYGEIHFYYPIKFDTKLSYDDISKKLNNSALMFNDELYEKIMDSLGKKVEKRYEDIQKVGHMLGEKIFSTKIKSWTENVTMKKALQDENKDDNIIIEAEIGNSSVKFYFKDRDLEEFMQRIDRLYIEQEDVSQYYGYYFTHKYQCFLLLPLKIQFINDEETWLYPLIYIFENNMAILKIEVPLINIKSQMLYDSNYDNLIKKVINKWNIEGYQSITSFKSIQEFYIKKIQNIVKTQILEYPDVFKNIILIDYDKIPKDIRNIPKDVKEELFRIVCAPVPQRENTSYEKDAIKYIEENSWGGHGINYIVKTTGGCLSIIDQSILGYVREHYEIQYGMNRLNVYDEYCINNSLAGNVSVNAEFALMIILLKKMNEENDYFNKSMHYKKLTESQNEYNRNIIFITALQEFCYGSASEQIIEFEKRMPYYIKHDLTIQKKEAINDILRQEEKEKNERFQNFIATGGLILTLIFGLPSIRESLVIVRNMCGYISKDIPYITLDNASVILWLSLNIFIIYKLYIQKYLRNIKNRYCKYKEGFNNL